MVGALLYALLILGVVVPPTRGHELIDSADVSTLEEGEPVQSVIHVGGNEIGGAVLMGGQEPIAAGNQGVSALQRAAEAALGRAEIDVHLPHGTAHVQSTQVKDKKQLGESQTKKLKYTYENTNWDDWELCKHGTKQSPINLQRPYYGAFNKLKMEYKDQEWPVQENDGLVLKVPFKAGDGSYLGIGDKRYTPTEAIFRAPAEHKLDGKTFDMEMQIMHKDAIGNQVGLAVLMQVSKNIPQDNFYIQNVFSHFWKDIPKSGNKRRVESMNLKWILNEEMLSHYVTYHGSMTHPPCSEGVEWFILGRPWLIEESWLKGYTGVLESNARPEQPTSNRMIKSF